MSSSFTIVLMFEKVSMSLGSSLWRGVVLLGISRVELFIGDSKKCHILARVMIWRGLP